MARSKRTEPYVRLNLEVSERTRDRIKNLRTRLEAETDTEVIRRAVAVLDELLSGDRIVLRAADGSEREILLR